jgi:hypothetical protein
MALPEAAQELWVAVRQRHQAILVALGIADMHPRARRIDVADRQPQPFAQAQSQTVEGEEEHPVTEHLRGGENPALNLAPFGRWTLRDKAAQRRLALR